MKRNSSSKLIINYKHPLSRFAVKSTHQRVCGGIKEVLCLRMQNYHENNHQEITDWRTLPLFLQRQEIQHIRSISILRSHKKLNKIHFLLFSIFLIKAPGCLFSSAKKMWRILAAWKNTALKQGEVTPLLASGILPISGISVSKCT